MIAISYRREDSMAVTGRLYDRLQARFGKQNVFMDFDSIRPGLDFRSQIRQTIDRAQVVLAVIGPSWLGKREKGGAARLADPNDFVRLEIAHALQRDIPVIPILVNEATMPRLEDLPEDMAGLIYRHALPLDSGLDFHQHADRVISGIGDVVEGLPRNGESAPTPAHFGKRGLWLSILTVITLVAMAAAASFFYFRPPVRTRTETTAAPSPAMIAATPTAAPSTPPPVATATPFKSAPATVYSGTIHTSGQPTTNAVPLTITFSADRTAGTEMQTSKYGDTVVKFNGVWQGATLRAVTGEVLTKPKNIEWTPESFTLRFSDDWQRTTYECNADGQLFTAELVAR